jgi:hypothetical protein
MSARVAAIGGIVGPPESRSSLFQAEGDKDPRDRQGSLMRVVFALALAGAMVNTGFVPGTETQLDKSIGTLQLASLDTRGGKLTDRFPASPEPASVHLASLSSTSLSSSEDVPSVVAPRVEPVVTPRIEENRYPVGEDPMNDSMVKTNRSVLAVPIADVPMERLCEALASAAEQHGLPVPFFARLIWQESRFRQSAVSPVGAQGVAQFMPQTANAYGLENPFDPIHALAVSARFLRELRDMFGNIGLAAAAYNGGSGRVQNWLARRGELPEETRNYVKIITGQTAETWTVATDSIDLAADLPRRAPCEGTAGLARGNGPLPIPVVITGWVTETLRKAEEAAAAAQAAVAAAAAKAKLLARAKGSKKSAATKAIAANAKSSNGKTAAVTDGGKADKKVAGKAVSKTERPSLVIAVLPEIKSAQTAAKSNAKVASKSGSGAVAKVTAQKSEKKQDKPIRLVDARR